MIIESKKVTRLFIILMISTLISTVAYASKELVWGRIGTVCVWRGICGQLGGGSRGASVPVASGSSGALPAELPFEL